MEAALNASGVSGESSNVEKPHGQHAATTNVGNKFAAPRGGFLGYLQAYRNPLTSLGFSGIARIGVPSSYMVAEGEQEGISKEKADSGSANDMTIVKSITVAGTNDTEAKQTMYQALTRGRYQLSTLVFVGLIAFLIGSLLRSLLSPADFIYVENDRHVHEGGGWREIRRLVEIKYLFGGWDFQIAVVRRH